jgi:hypothetical protein
MENDIKPAIKLLFKKGFTKTQIEEALSIVILTDFDILTEDIINSENFNFKRILHS